MSNLNDFWSQNASSFITSVAALVAASGLHEILRLIFQTSPKLVYWQVEADSITFGSQAIYVKTIYIKNTGRKEARGIRVIHNWRRNSFGVAVDAVSYVDDQTQDGKAILKLDPIHKGETCVITYVHNTPPSGEGPLIKSIRTDDQKADLVGSPTVSRYPAWVLWVYKVLAFVGTWFVLYVIFWALFHIL